MTLRQLLLAFYGIYLILQPLSLRLSLGSRGEILKP